MTRNELSRFTGYRSCPNRMKALEITGENLEDLLAYDDLFLDYFNAFLALKVFPIPLKYNRLTGAFEEAVISVPQSANGSNDPHQPLPYAPTDDERERLLKWSRDERLPLFLSTQLFREFKLCKLLLRPLDDRYTASRGSNHIRGYSRQSESYVSSLSNSADNSGHDEIDDDEITFMEGGTLRHSALYRYQRPGSKALSLPARVYFGSETTHRGSTITETHTTSRVESQSANRRDMQRSMRLELREREWTDPCITGLGEEGKRSKENTMVKFDTDVEPNREDKKSRKSSKNTNSQYKRQAPTSDAEEAFIRHARALSAPVNYEEYMRHPVIGDYDLIFGEQEPDPQGQVYVTFEDEGGSEEQTETDVKNLEGRLKMSLQQLKEQVLGSYAGLEAFKVFLKDTAGDQLFNFWMDCEYYKDTMEKDDDKATADIRNRLFRDIQDKYKMNLTPEASTQIAKAASNSTLTHTIFIRTQYDVLRRLRAYWVPRFLIHQEHIRELRALGVLGITLRPQKSSGDQHALPFFPSISLVNSMPVRPDNVLTYSKTKNWEFISKGGRSLDARVTSAKVRSSSSVTNPRSMLYSRSTRYPKDRFVVALTTDKVAGGPFQRFLEKQADKLPLRTLLFWQDVTEYGQSEDRSADRLLRLCHAWTIYQNYLSPDGRFSMGFSDKERVDIHATLQKAQDFIEASVFNRAKHHAVERLEQAWVRYLKEDLKSFLDAHVKPGVQSPPDTADVINITVTNEELIITRPMPWIKRLGHGVPTTDSERAQRLRDALALADSIDEERRAELKAQARERRKQMERERKKAIRAAYRRVREAKNKKENGEKAKTEETTVAIGINELENDIEEQKQEGDDMDFEIGDEKGSAKPPPPFTDMVDNKPIITNFKKYLQESEDKEKVNCLALYMDVENYLKLGNSKADAKKKDTKATDLFKVYVDSHGKKHLTFNEKVMGRMTDRPKTAVIKEMQHSVLPKIEEAFKVYLHEKAAENGMEPRDFANLSQADLIMRMGTDNSMLGKNWSKGRKGKPEEETAMETDENGPPGDKTSLPGSKQSSSLEKSGILSKQNSMTEKLGAKQGSKGALRELNFPAIKVNVLEHDENLRPRKVHFAGERTEDQESEDDWEGQTARRQDSQSNAPRKTRRHRKTGRAQPTKDDREEFYKALKMSAGGHLTLTMLYFYKYLLQHGEDEGAPLIDKDLFFYIEVQKFKDCSHAFSDEELLRNKVQSLIDCFLDSVTQPALQIDVPPSVHEKTLRGAQRYLAGKDVLTNIFDDAQLIVFKDLLPYWAGFRRTKQPNDPTKRPVTKYQKMLRKRLEAIENYEMPPNEFTLPAIPEGAVAAYSFSLSDGVKWRKDAAMQEVSSEEAQSMLGSPIDRSETATTFRGGKSVFEQSRKRRKSIVGSHLIVPGMSGSGSNPSTPGKVPVTVKE